MKRLKHKPCTIVYEKKAVLNGCKVFEYTDIKDIKYPKPFMVKDKREKTKSLIKEHYMEIMCEYDEAFTVQEMLEETEQCKDCKLNCINAGKVSKEDEPQLDPDKEYSVLVYVAFSKSDDL